MRKNLILFLGVLILMVLGTQNPVSARLGVGVGVGKIEVEERLRPGGIYNLPPISVLNTGDEAADYRMSVTFHEDQPEIRPNSEWFKFNPSDFRLEPSQAQTVEVELHLPLRLEPGSYFAYLEAGPLQVVESGESTIALAAATKLTFTVEPANLWWALYYKTLGLWRNYSPWTYIGAGVIPVAVIFSLLGKRFHVKPRRIKFS